MSPQTINLEGFDWKSAGVIDRLVTLYQPLIGGLNIDAHKFQQTLFHAVAVNGSLQQVMRNVSEYAQLMGIQVRGKDSLRSVA